MVLASNKVVRHANTIPSHPPLEGVRAFRRLRQNALADAPEATVSVRGKDCFVVMDLETYHYLRECELVAAQAGSQADVAARRLVTESVDTHLKRLAKIIMTWGCSGYEGLESGSRPRFSRVSPE